MGHSDGVIMRMASAIRNLHLLSFPNLAGHSCIRVQFTTEEHAIYSISYSIHIGRHAITIGDYLLKVLRCLHDPL